MIWTWTVTAICTDCQTLFGVPIAFNGGGYAYSQGSCPDCGELIEIRRVWANSHGDEVIDVDDHPLMASKADRRERCDVCSDTIQEGQETWVWPDGTTVAHKGCVVVQTR